MKGPLCACMILLGCDAGFAPLEAGVIAGDPTGLVGPAVTITFTEFGIPDDTAVTAQYAGLGIIFTSGMYQPSGAVINFSSGSIPTSPFSI